MFTGFTLAQTKQPGDPWWFEVEAIFFKRTVTAEQIQEIFDVSQEQLQFDGRPSFMHSLLAPSIQSVRQSLPVCGAPHTPIQFPLQTVRAPEISQNLIDNNLQRYEHELASRMNIIDSLGLLDTETVEPSNDLYSEAFPTLLDSGDNLSQRDTEQMLDIATSASHPIYNPVTDKNTNQLILSTTLNCQWPEEAKFSFDEQRYRWHDDVKLSQIPTELDGYEDLLSDKAYVLPATALELNNIVSRIKRNRELQPLLHMAWRQNVATGRENAPYYHIFAGERLKPIDGEPTEQSAAEAEFSDPIAIMEYVLSDEFADPEIEIEKQNKLPNWPIDGLLKIFIEYIGGTPYLHVDSKFDIAVPSTADKQQHVIRFEQLRRVISTEIHYFDHPAFGFILQIRRHQRPEPEEPASEGAD